MPFAEGQNPLCGDEVTVSVRFGAGDVIEEVGFEGRGCAISQAATSMLTDLVKGRTAHEVAVMPKDELLEEIGIPLTPVRLKCAMLGLGVLKVALHRSKGTPLPGGVGHVARARSLSASRRDGVARSRSARSTSCRPGRCGSCPSRAFLAIGVYNCGGELYALEDRCSHDDGPLCEGEFDCEEQDRDLPAPRGALRHHDRPGADAARVPPVETYPVRVRDDGRRRRRRSVAVESRRAGRRPVARYTLASTAERRWSGRDRFQQYRQWRYQRVEACPRDPLGNRHSHA